MVISGAAGNFVAPALSMSANGFQTVMDIDLIGTLWDSERLQPHASQQRVSRPPS